MEINKEIRILFLAFFSFIFLNTRAQVPVETSHEKIIVSGIAYYIHHVEKGQTAYSISRAYGITVDELTKDNPQVSGGLKEGQSLHIPAKTAANTSNKNTSSVKTAVKDEKRFIYHKLQPGQTIYSLSRQYGVTESEILNSNPTLEISKLSIGTEIAIPKKSTGSLNNINEKSVNQSQSGTRQNIDRQKENDQDKKYIYHKVEAGETLYSIAQKYGVTVRVLRKENKNMRFPKTGDILRIPASAVQETEQQEVVSADTIPEVIKEPEVKIERPVGYTTISNLKGTMDVAVLLPFNLPASSGGSLDPETLSFVEMYNGILLAADTLSSLGLNINIHTYDVRRDTATVTDLIRSGKLADMDLIIGPVHSRNLSIVSKYAAEHEIPVVSPVPLMNNSVLKGNPTLFMANSSLEVAQRALAKKIAESKDQNVILIDTDTTRNDPDVVKFRKFIHSELANNPGNNVRFTEMFFYGRAVFRNESGSKLNSVFSDTYPNTVIIASEEPPVVSEIITTIHNLSRRYNTRLLGYPSLIYLDNLDPRLFFELDLQVFSPYWIDYTKENVIQFNIDYMNKFLTMPLESSYAWIGYDITYYFLSGIAIHGKDFIKHPLIHNPELLQNEFIFERNNADDGFENQKLFIIRYTKDYEVKRVEE